MPLFKKPGEPYSINPWQEIKTPGFEQLMPTAEQLSADWNRNYGKIKIPDWMPIPSWKEVRDFVEGVKDRKPEERSPPPSRKEGKAGEYRASAIDGLDGYTGESVVSRAYELLLSDIGERYNLRQRPQSVMAAIYGRDVFGYENDDWIELAYDGPLDERLKAAAHELGAKRLRARNPFFDHARNERLVEKEASGVMKEYIEKALATRDVSVN